MVKRVISFIVILLAYLVLGTAVVISTSNFGLGFGEKTDVINNAYAMDRAGDIYYISDDAEEKSLVCIDSSGKKLYERTLETDIFGSSFYVSQIYVEHDKNIYLTVYSFNKDTMLVENASVHSFYEDGSYAYRIFSENISQYTDSRTGHSCRTGRSCRTGSSCRTAIISAFSEDDNNIYFSLQTGEAAEVFSAPKNNSELAAKIAEYPLSEDNIYGVYTSAGKEVFVGTPDGVYVLTDSGSEVVFRRSGAVFDRFWNGINQFYAMDSSTGDIYTVSEDMTFSNTVNGSRIINAEDGLSVSDMSDIAVGITGNIMGTIRGESESLYNGSFSVMYRVYTEGLDSGVVVSRVFADVCLAVFIVALTILTWDFYCGTLKMNLSILLRQSLLIILLISVMLFSLSYFIIIPQVENIVTNNYRHEAQMIANIFEDSLSGVIGNEESSAAAYQEYLYRYGMSAVYEADASDGDEQQGQVMDSATLLPQVHIVEMTGSRCEILASGELYPAGYPADMLLHYANFTQTAASMTERELFLSDRDFDGEKLYLIREISLPFASGRSFIVVGLRLNDLSAAVSEMQTVINRFLLLGGIVLVAIFVIIENITAGAVRKLKKSVDRIAAGWYNTDVSINTGDEVEQLSKSVKALSQHIVDKTTSLEKLNNSYYRFVPLGFLNKLGETQIEKVSKSLYAKRRMSVVYISIEFSQTLSAMGTEEIFESINGVFGQIVPIIGDNGGTAYNFLYNGLYAIFPDSTEDALRAAIRVREEISAYNEAGTASGRRTADIRIVISEDDVMLGFIGDEKRMEPSAVSGEINKAREVEKLCRESGLYIICTGSAFRSLPADRYRSRCIGKYTAEDSSELTLYDMFDSDPYSLIKLKEQYLTRFELAVSLFEKRDYFHARGQFMDIVKYAADDGVSRNYMYLAEYNSTAEKPCLTYTVFRNIL